MFWVNDSKERVKGIFIGYETKSVVTSNTGKDIWGYRETGTTASLTYYPQFEYTAKDGEKHRVTESKPHFFRVFKPGQEVEVIVSPYRERIAGFYSLYFLDLCILVLGLLFILIPLLIWIFAIHSMDIDKELSRGMNEDFKRMFNDKVLGPITVGAIIKGFLIFFLGVFLIGIGLNYFGQAQTRLLEAIQNRDYDKSRGLILKKEGINKNDEYNQTPLLLAMDAGWFDLARLLVEAGANVNVESKMQMTPLRIAAYSGHLEMVKLLLAKGASPDPPEGQFPPVLYALAQKHYDVARVLIESKCDLKRVYKDSDGNCFTIGDYTILAKRPELTELVRSRGGLFTLKP